MATNNAAASLQNAVHATAMTLAPATAITATVAGHFVGSESNDLIMVRANVVALFTWDESVSALRCVSETALPSRVVDAAVLPASMLGGSLDGLVCLFSETQVVTVVWSVARATFMTVAVHVLSPLHAVVTPATSIRGSGLPPIVRVDAAHGVCGILTHRRYLHLITVAGPPTSADAHAAASSGPRPAGVISAGGADDDGWADEDEEPVVLDKNRSVHAPSATPSATLASGAKAPAEYLPQLNDAVCVDLAASDSGNDMKNIRDFVFLTDGRTEPTIAVLRDVEPTWGGRVKLLAASGARVKGLSCVVSVATVARSSNAAGSTATAMVVSAADGIPYDAHSLHAVPTGHGGLGGALVVCASGIVHVSVKSASFGAFVNKHGEEIARGERSQTTWEAMKWIGPPPSTAIGFPEGVAVLPLPSADGNITARWLLAARDTGVLFHVVAEHNTRGVHRISMARLGPLVQAHTGVALAVRPEGVVAFFASHITDSVVVDISNSGERADASASLRLRVLTTVPNIGPVTSFALVDSTTPDADPVRRHLTEAQVYGGGAEAADAAEDPFAELVIDAALDPIPILGSAATLRDQLEATDIAVCGGRGEKNGSITVLSRHARVDAVLRRSIDCTEVFTVSASAELSAPVDGFATAALYTGESARGGKRARDDQALNPSVTASPVTGSRYLFMSTSTSTIVVEITDALRQMDQASTAFVTDQPTVGAVTRRARGDDASKAYCLQFTINSDGNPAGYVTVVDLADVTLKVQEVVLPNRPTVVAPYGVDGALVLLADGPLLCLTLRAGGQVEVEPLRGIVPDNDLIKTLCVIPHALDATGVEALVFTESGTAVRIGLDAAKSQWFVLGTFVHLHTLPAVVSDDGEEPEVRVAVKPRPVVNQSVPPGDVIIDAVACRLTGQRGLVDSDYTVALALKSGELCVYRLSPAVAGTPGAARRLVKMLADSHDVPPPAAADMSIAEKRLRRHISATDTAAIGGHRVFRPLARLAVGSPLDGILVSGSVPKLIVSDRGLPRLHPVRFSNDAAVRSAAALDYAQCPAGFVLCCPGSIVFARFSAERSEVDLRAPWPRSRVVARGTPRHICYNSTRRACVVATSRPEPYRPTKAPFDKELEINAEAGSATVVTQIQQRPVSAEEGIPIPLNDHYSLQLFSTVGWAHLDTTDLLENETVVCMETVILSKSGPTPAGIPIAVDSLCEVLAVGTAFPLGEDHACRGRLLLYGITSSGQGMNSTKRLVSLMAENTKGPVTAVTSIEGAIVAAIGASIKVLVADWTNRKLVTRAFAHAPTFITSLSTFKNFIVIGDLQRSCSLARYVQQHQLIEFIAHDPSTKDTLAVGAMFCGNRTVAVVTFDSRDNTQLFSIETRVAPNGADVNKTALHAEAQFKLSGTVRCSTRLRQPTNSRLAYRDSSAQLYVTTEGEIGVIAPLSEKAVRACRWLASRFSTEFAQPFALHPIAAREASWSETTGLHGQRIVDGELLNRFMMLSTEERRALATRAGMSADRARSVLVGLQFECDWF
jgi:cleavage and polyadenylation specificity factor subunit 1